MSRTRNIKIAAACLTISGIFVALFVYNYMTVPRYNACPGDESWCVRIHGNVNQETFVSLSQLQATGPFTSLPDQVYPVINRFGNTSNRTFGGIALDDVLLKTGVLRANATRLVFEASDGYASFELPLHVVLNNPGLVLLATRQNGEVLLPKDDGGDGPVMSAVSLAAIQDDADVLAIFLSNGQESVYNSAYLVKWLAAVRIV